MESKTVGPTLEVTLLLVQLFLHGEKTVRMNVQLIQESINSAYHTHQMSTHVHRHGNLLLTEMTTTGHRSVKVGLSKISKRAEVRYYYGMKRSRPGGFATRNRRLAKQMAMVI